MTIVTMKSEQAHNRWLDMLDIVLTGGRVIIERYSKPEAVLIGYDQWQATQQRLQEIELLTEVRRVKAKVANGEMKTISHEELKRLMLEKRAQGASTHVGA
ncbi:MAG: type II toxin-antitoxin system Phd/YefM family antitoxin [Caldilineaceae bacterium]